MTMEISTYEFTKTATFRIDDESNILKGVPFVGLVGTREAIMQQVR